MAHFFGMDSYGCTANPRYFALNGILFFIFFEFVYPNLYEKQNHPFLIFSLTLFILTNAQEKKLDSLNLSYKQADSRVEQVKVVQAWASIWYYNS